MRPYLFLFVLLAGVALPTQTLRAISDDEVTARKAALDLAGAFANDGFKIRDGLWTGNIGGEAKRVRVVQVNLFAGNQYWFCFGATSHAKKIQLAIFDEAGKPVESDSYNDEGKSAAGFSPQVSGPYYVKIQEVEGDQTECCLLYCYK
jgi:hypothetical protein